MISRRNIYPDVGLVQVANKVTVVDGIRIFIDEDERLAGPGSVDIVLLPESFDVHFALPDSDWIHPGIH